MGVLESTIARIGAIDEAAAAAARERQGLLTKPRGSLGALEGLSIRIAGMTGSPRPRIRGKAVFVMAGDHGVCDRGVSAYPREVTVQMIANMAAGGAGISVLSRQAGARVVIADVGVASALDDVPGLYHKKVRAGTADICSGPAMSRDEARRAVEAGIEAFEAEFEREPFGLAATGDMGIGNTTPSAALAAVFTGKAVRQVVGRGTGVDDEGLERKIAAIELALAVNRPEAGDALGALAAVGGLEIGAIAGVILAAAARRVPVLIDGFISGAGALVAMGLCPGSVGYMIAAHLSGDGGHALMLQKLGLEPLLSLGLRLGEGTGAVLAMGLCEAACLVLDGMATFGEAKVAGADS